MTAPHTSQAYSACNLNVLRRGRTYRATTTDGTVIGEYLGMEVPFGDWAILLRHGTGATSIAVGDVTSIELAA